MYLRDRVHFPANHGDARRARKRKSDLRISVHDLGRRADVNRSRADSIARSWLFVSSIQIGGSADRSNDRSWLMHEVPSRIWTRESDVNVHATHDVAATGGRCCSALNHPASDMRPRMSCGFVNYGACGFTERTSMTGLSHRQSCKALLTSNIVCRVYNHASNIACVISDLCMSSG